MKENSISNQKEILFCPALREAEARVASRLKERGVRFRWVNDRRDLARQLRTVPPALFVLDLARVDRSILEAFSEIEEFLVDCKTIIFGSEVDLQKLGIRRLIDVVFVPNLPDDTALTTALEKTLNDGTAFFDENRMWSNPYYFLFFRPCGMRKVKAAVDHVAPTDIPVLISGESGTEKELVAQAIHDRSLRRTKPFITLNCGAIGSEVLESELFGFEAGAFLGAHRKKPGSCELAHEGTLFLDEIGEMDGSLQGKLVRAFEDREFSRFGGEGRVPFNARVIACTKWNLKKIVEAGRFREDLYDCLNVVNIAVPPLRKRKEEIPSLTEHFLNRYHHRYGRSYPRLSEKTEEVFLNYDWPGNTRQLKDAIKRMVVLKDEEAVVREILGQETARVGTVTPASSSQPLEQRIGNLKDVGRRAAKEAERVIIQETLDHTRWNRRETADILQISYKALLYKIKEYGLDQ